jgi:hypothetical protein
MAPRLPEPFNAFVLRLQKELKEGHTEIRYGRNHHSHAVCLEDDVFRVRRLETTKEEAEAFMREHGMFMPENAEAISKPRSLEFEAANLDTLLELLEKNWPS